MLLRTSFVQIIINLKTMWLFLSLYRIAFRINLYLLDFTISNYICIYFPGNIVAVVSNSIRYRRLDKLCRICLLGKYKIHGFYYLHVTVILNHNFVFICTISHCDISVQNNEFGISIIFETDADDCFLPPGHKANVNIALHLTQLLYLELFKLSLEVFNLGCFLVYMFK